MNDIQIFNYGEIPVRTVLIDGEPWWVLADVCRVVNIKNPSDVKNRLDADEKMTIDLAEGHSGRRGGAQKATIINESGLYKVILRSDKPEAKAFTRWVTHEVLPAIRKTGSYGVTITEKEPFTNEQRIKVMDIISRCTQFTLPHVLKYCDPELPVCEPEKVKELSVSITVPPQVRIWRMADRRLAGTRNEPKPVCKGCWLWESVNLPVLQRQRATKRKIVSIHHDDPGRVHGLPVDQVGHHQWQIVNAETSNYKAKYVTFEGALDNIGPTGQIDNPAQLSMDLYKAEVSIQMFVQLREKVLSAYSEKR